MTTFQVPACALELTSANNATIHATITAEDDPKNSDQRGRIYKILLKPSDAIPSPPSLGSMKTHLYDQMDDWLVAERFVKVTNMENLSLKSPMKIQQIEGVFIRCAFLQSLICGRKGHLLISKELNIPESIKKEFALEDPGPSQKFFSLSGDMIKKLKNELKEHEFYQFEFSLEPIIEKIRMRKFNLAIDILEIEKKSLETDLKHYKTTVEIKTSHNTELNKNLQKGSLRFNRLISNKPEVPGERRSVSFKEMDEESDEEEFEPNPPPQEERSKAMTYTFDDVARQIEKCKKIIESLKQ
jgi:hypothetical protein